MAATSQTSAEQHGRGGQAEAGQQQRHRDQHDLQRRVKLRDVERADQHGLAEQGQHHDAAHDHDVAEHHQDGQPVRQHLHRREGHIHRHQQAPCRRPDRAALRRRCRRRCAAPASRPPRRTARPRGTGRMPAANRCSITSQTASGTAHSRAKVMTLGSVSSVVGRASADLRSVRHRPAFPRLHAAALRRAAGLMVVSATVSGLRSGPRQ